MCHLKGTFFSTFANSVHIGTASALLKRGIEKIFALLHEFYGCDFKGFKKLLLKKRREGGRERHSSAQKAISVLMAFSLKVVIIRQNIIIMRDLDYLVNSVIK